MQILTNNTKNYSILNTIQNSVRNLLRFFRAYVSEPEKAQKGGKNGGNPQNAKKGWNRKKGGNYLLFYTSV